MTSNTSATAVPAPVASRVATQAKLNGVNTSTGATVTAAVVAGHLTDELQVTVTLPVKSFFMGLWGVPNFHVTRISVAHFVPPVMLGQPTNSAGAQLGGTTADMGGTQFGYNLSWVAWGGDRVYADAFTPDPSVENEQNKFGSAPYYPTGSPIPAASYDEHQLNSTTGDTTGAPNLPAQGGWNYMVTIPSGETGYIQVYNAAQEGRNYDTPLYCNNHVQPHTSNLDQCATAVNSAIYDESRHFYDAAAATKSGGTMSTSLSSEPISDAAPSDYSMSQYTVFQVNPSFPNLRSKDTELSQLRVGAVDAQNYDTNPGWTPTDPTPDTVSSNNNYIDVATGNTITQKFNPSTGDPTNMLIVRNWISATNYPITDPGEKQLVTLTQTPAYAGGALPAGTYRLRIDALAFNGAVPGTSNAGQDVGGMGAKSYALRVVKSDGQSPCTDCALTAMNDINVFTSVSGSTTGTWTVPIDLYDPGDIQASSGGGATMSIIEPDGSTIAPDPTGNAVTGGGSGDFREFPSTASPHVAETSANQVIFQTNDGSGSKPFKGRWLHIQLPIPANYSVTGWWYVGYSVTPTTHANDGLTFAVQGQQSPVNLLSANV
jgi:hypothetical protein